MKRIWIFALLAAALTLSGCSGPDKGPPPGWDESWVRIAEYIGVEPLNGFTLNESNDLLSVSGLYYATWTSGGGREFVNADGDEATVYDPQIYVLLGECRSAEAAREAVGTWSAREKQSYETGEAYKKLIASQEFEILPLTAGREGNPYPHGAAAFAVRDEWAVSVELVCSDSFTGDSQAILERFLAGFHYSGE